MDILVWAGFRTHLLLPHDVVGTIIDGEPTWPGLTVDQEGVYRREGRPVLATETHAGPKRTKVAVRALTDVWLQEPGLAVKIAGGGSWRGVGPDGRYTTQTYTLKQKDAHRATVHFSRAPESLRYTAAVEYREDTHRWRLLSDGGFTRLLNMPPATVPWEGCQVFGQGYELEGVVRGHGEILRRWELAGLPPDVGQMYFLGWTGGAGAVTDLEGRDVGAPGNKYLWNPRGWRRLGKGQTITQTVCSRHITG